MAARRADDPSINVPPEDEQDAPGDPESVARAICLRLLTQRARSRAELAEALRRRGVPDRSEEHTSELQSRPHLVCRLLLEKKKKEQNRYKTIKKKKKKKEHK